MNQKSMSVARKAAIVVATLDPKVAASIMRTLAPDSLRRVTAEIRHLGEITDELRDQAFHDLAYLLVNGANPSGGDAVARALLQEVVGDSGKANELLETAVSERERAFAALAQINGKDLANILCKEQPATIAIILGFLPPKKAAEVISGLPTDMRESIVKRLAHKRHTDPNVVSRIEKVFVEKVISLLQRTRNSDSDDLGGPKFVAEICQHSDHNVEEEILGHVQQLSPDLAEEIRDMMFTFDDIIRLSDVDVQRVLRDVQLNDLVLALKGVDAAVFEKISSNLSKRAQENLKEEMEMLGRTKRKEVEAQQKEIVALIRRLETEGEVSTTANGEDDEYL